MLNNAMTSGDTCQYNIHIKGLVQGVGFRPFIYRVANELRLQGTVENRNDGVVIRIQCTEALKNELIRHIKADAPVASYIHSIQTDCCQTVGEILSGFQIIHSKNVSNNITQISPDIAVCRDCRNDMTLQPHRIFYPFINCTNCGPRFSIIQDLPYDRHKTTMRAFEMCDRCQGEYTDVLDRRFHAQPIACNDCGPHYTLYSGQKQIHSFEKILATAAELINAGKVIAIKGVGGYYLACDALDPIAVSRLRTIKKRDGKPFAVMFSDINQLKGYAHVTSVEETALQSWQRPILLLKQTKPLAQGVSITLNTIGAMLPYMPFHYLLFEKLKTPAMVLTSGNISDEPIIIDNSEAIDTFQHSTDAVLTYNRDIFNRVDDSVLMVVNENVRTLRRSRGFVPNPVHLPFTVDGILATGAELVNCFCVGKNKNAYLSQHIGDLKNLETYDFYTQTISRFNHLLRSKPRLVACDLHPDYLSSAYAKKSSLPVIRVQHHHAHIAACMAEHGLDEKVIGVAFDGTGLGTDGNIWGAEFFICDLLSFDRLVHFDYIPMPGGDKAATEPWRMGISYLYKIFGEDLYDLELEFIKQLHADKLRVLLTAIQKKINTPVCSSAGRLFDAVAAITNICPHSSFHAEAPMRLEAIIDEQCQEHYTYSAGTTITFDEMIRQIVEDKQNRICDSIISAKFHNTIIALIEEIVIKIKDSHNINKVVLSGGTFQNKYLSTRIENRLKHNHLDVYCPCKVPGNDGGIALGQLAVAAKMTAPS